MKMYKNEELSLKLHSWGTKKLFLASEIMNQLGYKGGNKTLQNYNLIEWEDKVTLQKSDFKKFFDQLVFLKFINIKTSTVIFLYESGVWKLVMQSKKPIGVKTRNWLATEVLPTIRETGKYNIENYINNPFSYLHDFTENKKQIENSKAVAKKTKEYNLSYSFVFNQIHKMVLGKTAKEIKNIFKSKESAREILRQYRPDLACTEAVIDEIYTKYNKSLKEIEESKAHKTLPPAFKSLYDLGINF